MMKHLGPHGPDALLAFGMVVATGSLIEIGVKPALAVGLCAGLFLVYAVRQSIREKHLERMKGLEIQNRQLQLQETQNRASLKLQKAKGKGPGAQVKSGTGR